jgi:hypothetical protein
MHCLRHGRLTTFPTQTGLKQQELCVLTYDFILTTCLTYYDWALTVFIPNTYSTRCQQPGSIQKLIAMLGNV